MNDQEIENLRNEEKIQSDQNAFIIYSKYLIHLPWVIFGIFGLILKELDFSLEIIYSNNEFILLLLCLPISSLLGLFTLFVVRIEIRKDKAVKSIWRYWTVWMNLVSFVILSVGTIWFFILIFYF